MLRLLPVRLIACTCAIVGTMGCRERAPEATRRPAETKSPAASAAPSATGAASATPAVDAGGPADAGSLPDDATAKQRRAYFTALGAGRAATRRHDWDAAIAAFDRAQKILPTDARARAERGFARLQSGDLDGAADDLDAASRLAADPDVHGQIWFNLGLVREKAGRAEDAQLAFAMANLLRPSKAAADKLAGKSRCPAVIQRAKLGSLDAAEDFRKAYEIIFQTRDAGISEAKAKNEVCRAETYPGLDEGSAHACDGPPPWAVAHDYQLYRYRQHFLVPRGKGKGLFVYDAEVVGGWPAHCTGYMSASLTVVGTVIRATDSFSGAQSVLSESGSPDGSGVPLEEFGPNAVCLDGDGQEVDHFFDSATGRELLQVRRIVPRGSEQPLVSLRIVGRTVELSGGACAERIALDGPAP